jgi:hypothetical protein
MLSKIAWTVLFAGLLASAAADAEVYIWKDENGVTHFSETPPPSGQEAEIADLPDMKPAASQQVGVEGEPPLEYDGMQFDLREPTQTDTPAETASIADLKRQQLAENRARRQAEAAKLERECQVARNRVAQIEPSRRVFYTNEAGEEVRMDDDERVSEVEQLHDFIDRDCR